MNKKVIEILDEKYEIEFNANKLIRFPYFSITLMSEENVFEGFDRYFVQSEASTKINYKIFCLINGDYVSRIINFTQTMMYYRKIKTHKSSDSYVFKYQYGISDVYLNFEKSFVLLINPNNEMEYIFIARNEKSAKTDLLRIIRELYYELMEQDNHIMMHCATASYKDNSYLICGEKCSGKTTTLVGFIEAGADFIGNDRVFLEKKNGNMQVSFFPLPIRIGLGTIRQTAAYKKIKNHIFEREQKIDDYSDEELLRPGFPVKYELTPKEFTELYKCQYYMQKPLKCIIFPNYDPSANNVEITLMKKENALIKLLQCCMTPRDEDWPNRWIFEYNDLKLEMIEQAVEFLESVVEETPMFELRFGNNADFKIVLEELEKRRIQYERKSTYSW